MTVTISVRLARMIDMLIVDRILEGPVGIDKDYGLEHVSGSG